MHDETLPSWTGYARANGQKGIRNLVLVIYTVECAKKHLIPYKFQQNDSLPPRATPCAM